MMRRERGRTDVTVKDVARRAGVAPSTVSNVLSNRHDCWASQETRERIHQAVQELGYRANPMARALRRGNTCSIGFVVPDICNPFNASLARALESRLRVQDYTLIIEDAHSDPERARQAIDRLLSLGIDGIIPSYQSAENLPELSKRRLPVIGFSVPGAEWSVDCIEVDLAHGIGMLVDHLVELGHSRLGFLHGTAPGLDEYERLGMLRRVLHDRRLELPDGVVWTSGHTPTEARLAASAIFALPPGERPTALICPNDFMALGVMRAARDAGLSIPGDISILGFDDSWLADMLGQPDQSATTRESYG